MTAFKPLNFRKFQQRTLVETPDTLYWQRLSVPTLVKEFGAIDYVDFSPVEPYCFAVTCSMRVQIYNPASKLVVKNLSRFHDTVYGGSFRQDGRLLVAGDEQCLVKLLDASSKNVLRLFKGHTGPVHRTFFTADKLRIASFSDDRSVRLWDVASEKCVQTCTNAHEDYVRAGAMSPVSPTDFVSGGYDGIINFYDTRSNLLTHTVDHGRPVEALIYLPSGGIVISAGDTEIRVWDRLGGCRLLTKFSEHHKTITSLQLGSNGRRLLSAGLDRHVKIYDVATYETVHTLTFPNAVLSLGVAPKNQVVAAGMVDGLISIQTMAVTSKPDEEEQIMRRISSKKTKKTKPILQVDHQIKDNRTNQKLAKYDLFFRRYEYNKALDNVFTNANSDENPELIVAVMQELVYRKGLNRALAHRPEHFLRRLIKFIVQYIGENRFIRVLTDVTTELLDIYEDKFHDLNESLADDFTRLAEVLDTEIRLTNSLLELQGMLELLATACVAERTRDESFQYVGESRKQLKPSKLVKSESHVYDVK